MDKAKMDPALKSLPLAERISNCRIRLGQIPYKSKREAANAYRKAAAFLERNPDKWTRGYLENGNGCFCAVGALNKVNTGHSLVREGLGADYEYILELTGTEHNVLGVSIVSFNDHRAQCPLDVVRALRKVARALDHGAPMIGLE